MAPGSFHTSTEPGEDDACSYGGKASIIPNSLCVQEEPYHLLCLGSWSCATQDVSSAPSCLPLALGHTQQCQPVPGCSSPLPSVLPTASFTGQKQTAAGRLDLLLGKHWERR